MPKKIITLTFIRDYSNLNLFIYKNKDMSIIIYPFNQHWGDRKNYRHQKFLHQPGTLPNLRCRLYAMLVFNE